MNIELLLSIVSGEFAEEWMREGIEIPEEQNIYMQEQLKQLSIDYQNALDVFEAILPDDKFQALKADGDGIACKLACFVKYFICLLNNSGMGLLICKPQYEYCLSQCSGGIATPEITTQNG